MDSAATFRVPPSLHVAALLLDEDGVTIHALSEATDVRCPVCGEPSGRVHSRYQRTVADLPWARFAVRLQIQVRRFVCANLACPRAIFAERLVGIAPTAARRTARQRERLTDLALALGGEAGARLAAKLGMPVSPDTVDNHQERQPPEPRAGPTLVPRLMHSLRLRSEAATQRANHHGRAKMTVGTWPRGRQDRW